MIEVVGIVASISTYFAEVGGMRLGHDLYTFLGPP